MRRHHLLLFIPVLVTALFVGWVTAEPGSVPAPMVVAVVAGGPGVFAGVLLGRHWRARRRAANERSLFSR